MPLTHYMTSSSPLRYNHKTGEWAHTSRLTRFPERKWLSHFDVTDVEHNFFDDRVFQHRDYEGNVTLCDQSEMNHALGKWGVSYPRSLFERIKSLALTELESIKVSQEVKSRKMKSFRSRNGGGGVVALTAFENIRWFVMADDVEIMSGGIDDDGGCDMILKGTP